MKPKILIIAMLFVITGIACGAYYYGKNKGREKEKIQITRIATDDNCVSDPSAESDPVSDTEASLDLISAYICGEVQEPGVYRLGRGSRVDDLLKAAGGFTEKASRVSVNLARLVADGEMIYIPDASEAASAIENPDGTIRTGPVNINTAGVNVLTSLPGIGETRAKAIVDFRARNGTFKTKEDIKKVSGIGDSIYSEIEALITV